VPVAGARRWHIAVAGLGRVFTPGVVLMARWCVARPVVMMAGSVMPRSVFVVMRGFVMMVVVMMMVRLVVMTTMPVMARSVMLLHTAVCILVDAAIGVIDVA
jgi:hypothetical protein